MAFIKINRQNFFHNLTQFALKIGSKERIGIVLKDNAYGHGLKLMAQLSKEFGITQAVVRTTKEARMVEPYFQQILILGDRALAEGTFSYALNSLEDIQQADEEALVELKVDTGMHRNGISMDELEEALSLIKERNLSLVGVMTHNRSADVLSSELFWQQKQFETVKKKVEVILTDKVDTLSFHSFNTASTLRLSCENQAFIRLGIGAYGYSELPQNYEVLELKPVLSLWAKKMATRKLKKGESVGYGGTFTAPKDMIISTYDLGYGDGWMRSNSFHPFVTAEGLPILGRVSMDYILLESTKEEICIFDNALDAGRQIGTISYEVMTLLSRDIRREVH